MKAREVNRLPRSARAYAASLARRPPLAGPAGPLGGWRAGRGGSPDGRIVQSPVRGEVMEFPAVHGVHHYFLRHAAHEYSGPAGVRTLLMPRPRRVDQAGARATKTARAGGGRGPICPAEVAIRLCRELAPPPGDSTEAEQADAKEQQARGLGHSKLVVHNKHRTHWLIGILAAVGHALRAGC